MRAHGPDGRVWEVARRPDPRRPLASLLPGTTWQVEARAGDELRAWPAASRAEANRLVTAVAMSLRTGSPGPAGELAPGDDDAGDDPGDTPGDRGEDTDDPGSSATDA